MEQEQKPVTFGRIVKVAFTNWIRLLIIAASITLVGTLAIEFGYNRVKTVYSSTFSYNRSDLNNGTYVDETSFFYTEVFSRENLEAVAKSSEDYASINIDAIFDNNDVTYSREFNEEIPVYTLNIPKKYFKSNDQAQSFFSDVIVYPINRDDKLLSKDNYESSLKAFDDADTFENQILLLKNHAESLIISCTAVVEDEKASTNTKLLAQSTIGSVKSIAGENYESISNLNFIVDEHGYVKDYEAEEVKDFDNKLVALAKEKALNEEKIAALEAEVNKMTPSVVLTVIDETIATLTQRNVEIDREIAVINLKISKKSDTSKEYLDAKKAFAESLVSFRNRLSQCTESYVNMLVQKSGGVQGSVSYNNINVITTRSNIAIPIALLLSFVGGVVVGGVVNLIVDRKKLKV